MLKNFLIKWHNKFFEFLLELRENNPKYKDPIMIIILVLLFLIFAVPAGIKIYFVAGLAFIIALLGIAHMI